MSAGMFFENPTLLMTYLETGLIPVIIGYLLWERREDKKEHSKNVNENLCQLSDLIKEDIRLTEKLITIIDERLRK